MSCFEDCYPEIWEERCRKEKPWNYNNGGHQPDADEQAIIEHLEDSLRNPQNYKD
ncbi:MAG: hypothetical protein PVJ67_02605 [Candidatus Pacearchaeota archaeon]|jgi:hypothetical protein